MVYNDYVIFFFFDYYFVFVLGVGSEYEVVDEGGGVCKLLVVGGYVVLVWYIGSFLMVDEFDMVFF